MPQKSYDNKSICWSYPTSINAKRYGFYNTGCWTVELIDSRGYNLPKSVKGFAKLNDAKEYADTLQENYVPSFNRFYNEYKTLNHA